MCINLTYSQSPLKVIGSVHAQTKYITVDTLLKELLNFKPDVILLELDSSLMDATGNFKMKREKMSLESQTAQGYKQENPKTQLLAIDVVYRNRFYKEHNTFALENKVGKAVDSLYKNNMLNDTSWFIVNSLYSATQVLNNLGYMQLKDINSKLSMEAASLRQSLLYKRQLEVIKNNKSLKGWYPAAREIAEFWDLRNKTMVNNIIKVAKRYRGKRIAVIVGYFHKYALVDGLRLSDKRRSLVLVD